MTIDLEKVLLAAQVSAYMAGDEIINLRNSFEVSYKSEEKEIVTTADLRANQVIQAVLHSLFPEIGWLSEETKDNPARLKKELVWLVDPLDGTKYFAKGEGEFTVSIALVDNGSPIVGAIYQPTERSLFYAAKGKGAYLNGNPINVSSTNLINKAKLITTNKVKSKPGFKEIAHNIHYNNEIEIGGTALRLAKLAKGEADFYLSMGNAEWGIAAGDIILQEAGGRCTDLQGNSLVYNKLSAYVVPMLMSNSILHDKILESITAQPK